MQPEDAGTAKTAPAALAEAARYCALPEAMQGGNVVTLLKDGGQAYPAMLEAIALAERTVHLETYILRSDRTGRRFGDALAAAAKRGLRVRLIFDAVGSFGIDRAFLDSLASAGVELLQYHPLALFSPLGQLQKRDHRKLLVVDARVGFTGGLNIGDEYAPVSEGGQGWRDNHVRVVGPAAWQLDAAFLQVWNRNSPQRAAPAVAAPAAQGEGARIRVVTNDTFLSRHAIRTAYLKALRQARRTIEIENSYFVPDHGIRRALRAAAQRGVRVRLIVPDRSDVPIVRYASRAFYEKFLKAGVRIFEYAGAILHAKTVVVDGLWSAVGSYNIDHRSLRHNLEINLHMTDPAFGAELGRAFEADLDRSVEIRLADWRRRPWLDRVQEAVAYNIRGWL